jgi:hypothetical protein
MLRCRYETFTGDDAIASSSKTPGRHMDSDFGLLWIPAGFALIFVSVAALFLTVAA